MSAVILEGVTKHFKLPWRRGVLQALDHLDMTVRPGEIFGLLGPNGSGKSTAMKLILGLIQPTKGRVEVAGMAAGSIAAREKLGFLPENPYFPQFLSAREVLHFYGPLCGLTGKKLSQRADELLELVGLENAAQRPLKTFSKGMLQRIGLAQALIHDPEILLLDEPTAGVDPLGGRQIRDLMLELRRRGKTILFSSHLLDQVQEVADRVAILHLGKKLCEGTLDELLTRPGEVEIRAQSLLLETQRELLAWLEQRGASNAQVMPSKDRLEDYFIQKVTSRELID